MRFLKTLSAALLGLLASGANADVLRGKGDIKVLIDSGSGYQQVGSFTQSGLSMNDVSTEADSITLNTNAAESGADWKATVKDGFMRADGSAVPAGCTDCVIPAGTALPNMTNRYMRGNTSSGGTGGANTVTPSGTVSQPTFSGNGTLHTAWFKNSGMSLTFTGATTSYTVNVPGHTHNHSLASSLGLSGSAPSLSNNLVAANGHTHDAPAHYHGFSLATTIGISGSAPSLTGTTTFVSSGSHSVTWPTYTADSHTHASNVGYAGNEVRLLKTEGFTIRSGAHDYFSAALGSTTGTVSYYNTSGPSVNSTTRSGGSISAHGTASVGITGGSYSTTGSNSVGGSVGNTGGSNGNNAMGTTVNSSSITVGISGGSYSLTGSNNVTGTIGSGVDDGDSFFTASGNNTPSGSVTMNAANDNMQEWAASGSYTPSGTVSQPTFTGDSENNEPSYMEVVWVVRVK